MINVSDAFKKKLDNDQRDYLEKIDLTLKDGTELHLTNADIWGNSFAIEDAVGSDDTFSAIGSAIINSCSFTINNIYGSYDTYDFTDAVATVYVGLDIDGEPDPEYIKKGVFTVYDTSYNGSMIGLKLYDNMHKFDRPYTESTLVYGENGRRLYDVIYGACYDCGVTLALGSRTFPNHTYVVKEPNISSSAATFREVISWASAIAGCFARINTDGELEVKWFDKTLIDQTASDLDGGRFDQAENILSNDKRISSVISANGVTATYDQGRWHITGTPNTTQEITLTLYEDIFSAKQGTYTLRLELEGFSTISNPFRIGMNYWPDDSSIEYTVELSPYVSQMYSLTELAVVIPATSGSRSEYDGYVRVLVEKGNTGVYQSGDIADGGSFNPWDEGYDYKTPDDFVWSDAHYIGSTFSQNIGVDDIVITKVTADIKVDGQSGVETKSYGTDGYAIHMSANEFVNADNVDEIIQYVGNQIIGLTFRKAEVSHLSDPTIEAGDVAFVFDNKGNRFPILVTRTNFKVGSAQTTVCGADSPLRNSATRLAEATKSYVDIRKRLIQQQTDFERAQKELSEALASVNQMYTEKEYDANNNLVAFYIMDKSTRAQSQTIWKITTNAFGVSTDGGETWNMGATADGDLVARVLNANGINANWIRSGQLIITDGSNNETFFADTETGEVRINATAFTLKVNNANRTIQNIAEGIAQTAANTALGDANTYTDDELASAVSGINATIANKETTLNNAIQNLQNQVDGQIDMYYEEYEPSTTKPPASQWIADGKEADHEGDVFCNTTTGYSYRWFQTNGVWGWNQISDTGTAQAIAAAREASTLASQKKRVFITTPVPPYETGDLWVQGSTGDIMRCKSGISRASSDSYTATDWEKASKYTDDTAVDNLQIGGKNLLQKTANFDLSVWTLDSCSRSALRADLRPINDITHCCDGRGDESWHVEQTLGNAKLGEEYTVSGYIRLSSNRAEDTDTIGVQWGDGVLEHFGEPVYSGSGWKHFHVTHKYTTDVTGNNKIRLLHSSYTGPLGVSYFYICGLKLEKGNRATDWTKSPEDVAAEVTAEITEAIGDLKGELEDQIDGKVQTWVSASDPSTNWTAEQKETNVGDLWYYTGESIQNSYQNNCTYQYTSDGQDPPSYSWTAYSTSMDLFDAIDGKRQIFYGSPDGSYGSVDAEDLLIDTDGTTYKWVVPQTGSPHWEQTSEIAVGGRNLLCEDVSNPTYMPQYSYLNLNFEYEGSGCWHIYGNYTGGSSTNFTLYGKTNDSLNITEDGTYTFSFEYEGLPLDDQNKCMTWISHFEEGSTSIVKNWLDDDASSSYPRTVTYTCTRTTRAGIWFNSTMNGVAVDGRIRLKLERGNRATDWSPAPEDVSAALEGLRGLIADSKITTWYRDTDPSEDPTVWDNTENHVGDIWYCNDITGDYAERTWRWNGSSWSEMKSAPPKEVFDQIDGKAHIYIGTDEPTNMAEGDLWFKSTDEPILTCVNGEWTEYNKYTDDTVANAVGDEVRRVERELSAEIKSLGDSVEISITETNENLEEIKTHYRFDETGETIGKTGSPKTIKLANDGIGMQVNGETVTKWNQDEMYTPTKVRVPVGGSLQLGDFIFQPRSSGNISLLFVGGD